ncbi:MAG: hypothetical protein ACRCUQ_03200 [Alphaproteobacteria bacterium]
MSSQLISATFLKLAFIVFMAPQFAFSTGTAETSSEPRSKYRKLNEKPVSQPSPFERLPSDIIKLILAELQKKDLLNLREVETKLRNIATLLITNVQIPANLPNQKQVERFFKDLTTVKFLEKRGPSEAFVNLFRQAPVEDLSLSNRKINDEKITTIAPALPVNLKNLDLSENNIGDAGIQALVLRLPPTLESLNLSYNNIGDAGAQALAHNLPSTLKWLYLNQSNIRDAGAQALAHNLPPTLQGLWLSENNISEKSFQALVPRLPPTLESLNLSYNNIGDTGAQALALRFPSTLKWLYLNQSNIRDAGAQALAHNLPSTLKWLQLGGNNIGDIGLSALLEAIPRTDLGTLVISVPSSSPLRARFENLRNRHGKPISVIFW